MKWTSPGFPTVVVLRPLYQVFLEGFVVVISPDVAYPEVDLAAAWVAADFELVEPSALYLFVVADVVSVVAEPVVVLFVVVADVVSEVAQLVVAFAADASVADVA